jgi:glutamate 5-kinase
MRRVVLKVGSAVLTQDGRLAHKRLDNLVELIVILKKQYEVILVSSGAVAAGFTAIQLDKKDIVNKQTLASVGQPLLISTYSTEFKKYDILCSQVLLEASIFEDKKRLDHSKKAIDNLLKHNIVPIVNENDVTAIDELVFGDNDQLAAYITHYFNAQLLVILTDIDGFYDKNPHENSDATMHKNITTIKQEWLEQQHSANNEFATGGIVTKLKAAQFLLKHKNQMFLTSGFDLGSAQEYLLNNNHTKGTLFKSTEG